MQIEPVSRFSWTARVIASHERGGRKSAAITSLTRKSSGTLDAAPQQKPSFIYYDRLPPELQAMVAHSSDLSTTTALERVSRNLLTVSKNDPALQQAIGIERDNLLWHFARSPGSVLVDDGINRVVSALRSAGTAVREHVASAICASLRTRNFVKRFIAARAAGALFASGAMTIEQAHAMAHAIAGTKASAHLIPAALGVMVQANAPRRAYLPLLATLPDARTFWLLPGGRPDREHQLQLPDDTFHALPKAVQDKLRPHVRPSRLTGQPP